jgi:TetR/AcrR family transcriptional regulator, transcriptional repressor for nem operon
MMRFEKGHKENTRRRIIDVASKRFRREGAAASGLAGIMSEAGLTNGAFYPHFESKETLLREAVVSALSDQFANLEESRTANFGIEDVIRDYLNVRHLQGT